MSVGTFTTIINQLLPEPHAGLLSGILFGTKATLSKELYAALVATGTLHIVALSGMNITILTAIVAAALGPFFSKRVASLITIVIIILFILFVGPSPSVIRAGIMGGISLIAISLGRQYWSLYTLILAVGIMLLLRPLWIGDLSFQLSVLATLGIVLFGTKRTVIPRQDGGSSQEKQWIPGRARNDTIQFIRSFIEDNLRITLAAQVFTIPLIFMQFHRISLVSPLSNILIGWTVVPITVLGFLVAIFGWIWLPLGQVVAWVAWIFLEYLVSAIYITSHLPFASLGFN